MAIASIGKRVSFTDAGDIPLIVKNPFAIVTTRVAGDFTTNGTTSAWAITDTSAPRTATLGSADEVLDRIITITDESIGAFTSNITITTQSGSLIDGAASTAIVTNGGGVSFKFDGTDWKIQPSPDTTTASISAAIANYTLIDNESKLPALVGGEHLLTTGTYEFVDDPITGGVLIIVFPVKLGPGVGALIRGDKLANPVVYVGGGGFVRASITTPPLGYIQLNFLLVSLGGTAFDYAGGFSFFADNFSFLGGGWLWLHFQSVCFYSTCWGVPRI